MLWKNARGHGPDMKTKPTPIMCCSSALLHTTANFEEKKCGGFLNIENSPTTESGIVVSKISHTL